MKTITIKRRRRMTKHRKGMNKPRKSNRRIKNRKHKTRRQSGGWGWKSFIKAQDNPRSGVEGKGIDVKHKTGSSGEHMWLIGNTDKTFIELKAGAKDGRYLAFINVLLKKYPRFDTFETPKKDRDSPKGIILTDAQFCALFINEPFVLDYPRLREKFNSSGFACAAPAPSAAGTSAAGTSAASLGPQLHPNVLQLINMGFSQTEAMNALSMYNNNVNHAANYLSDPAPRGGVVAQPGFGSAQVATIDDFLNAQSGEFPQVLGGISCPKFTDALAEINRGQKEKCWIWYILPSSPGQSDISKFFGIGPRANVTPEQYLDDPTLSARYVAMLNAIGIQLINYMKKNAGRPFDDVTKFLIDLMGKKVDYEKLKDSLTIFYPFLHDRKLVVADDTIALLYRNIFPETLLGPPTGLRPSGPSAVPPTGPSAAFGPPLPSEQTIQLLNIAPFKPPCDEYIVFEHQISDTPEQPDKILKNRYSILVDDKTSLNIALSWAHASYHCNSFYVTSFMMFFKSRSNVNYEDLVNASLAMDVATKITIIQKREVPNDGWCFYRAVLTAAQRNPDHVRKFAQAITCCVIHIFTNTEDAMKQPLNTRVNGIQSQITAAQLVKLISIPNLTEKNHPCVYPDLDQCIGQAAAYILQKNICIYHENGSVIGKYRGTVSTKLDDQIFLVNTGENHFDIITSFNS